MTTTTAVKITTFGYLWGPAPEATLTIDLRGQLVNPYKDASKRHLTALDPEVYRHVMNSRGALSLAHGLYVALVSLRHSGKPLHLAVGCAGGLHRSVSVGRRLEMLLSDHSVDIGAVELVHRDVAKGVFIHPKES